MEFEVLDVGRRGYFTCVDLQREILEDVLAARRPPTLILVEHDPVITLGAGFHESNLLLSHEDYAKQGIDVLRSDRGGDVTYHGPGQLVAYPIFSLEPLGKDLHKWLRDLEEVAIVALRNWDLMATRNPVNTGVWIENRKICAIGIKVRRWVSMHGLALNCDVDLAPFATIIPCGIQGAYGVTSITAEIGRPVSVKEAKPKLVEAFLSLAKPLVAPSGEEGKRSP